MLSEENLHPLLAHLKPDDRTKFQDIIITWQLTFQEVRQLVDISIDLNMWQESSFFSCWEEETKEFIKSPEKINKQNKKQVIVKLLTHWLDLKHSPKSYAQYKSSIQGKAAKKTGSKDSGNKIFGTCPVASEKTICCNLKTIDVVQNCGLACSYCSIQTFYNEEKILFETDLDKKLAQIELDPNVNYHFGTGQSSDSLLWGNQHQILEHLFAFARKHPNVLLEFKTKTKNTKDFLALSPPSNAFCSWSLNPQEIINNEEHLSASLEERLQAARTVADQGVKVGFHFHPIVYFENWEEEYLNIAQKITSKFKPSEIIFISMGTVTFIKPVIKQIRKYQLKSKILQMPLEEVCGRYSYSKEIKEKIFKGVYQAFKAWHSDVFFYLCMEPKEYWDSTFNFCYENNEQFEKALLDQALRKTRNSN